MGFFDLLSLEKHDLASRYTVTAISPDSSLFFCFFKGKISLLLNFCQFSGLAAPSQHTPAPNHLENLEPDYKLVCPYPV